MQLGELTLNQHHMTLLEPAIAAHPDLQAALGAGEARRTPRDLARSRLASP